MKTIRVKFNLALLLVLLTGTIFGFKAYREYQGIENTQAYLSESFRLRNRIATMDPKNNDAVLIQKLQKHKKRIIGDDRRRALSNLIQAYNAHNPRLFNVRLEEFNKSEKEFFHSSVRGISKFKKEFRGYLALALGLPLLGFGFLFYYFNFQIVTPLDKLGRRMMGFLVDQYSFKMTAPKNNEIGYLEGTFNSMAQKVLNYIEELKSLDQAKSEFVSITSHELRTPLTSIKGSLGLLTAGISGQMDDEARELVSVADHETDRLVRLINDLLDLAKIESNSITLKKDWCSLDEVIEKTMKSIQGFAVAAKVELTYDPMDSEVSAHMDPDRIQQVLTNLISNAIKYSPEGEEVTIEADTDMQNNLLILISDKGRGISTENQDLIFEKFRQATDSSSPLVKGTGLGLAISKALVEQHNGDIGVHSTPGEGATFFFSLKEWRIEAPLVDEELQAA